jgi:hypothetical protein
MSQIDTTFLGELENIFRDEFLKAAPLYAAASKIKLPFEDAKKTTVLYRGSLNEEARTVESVADYELFKFEHTEDDVRAAVTRLASAAGILVDGLIRLENVRSIKESDPRQTANLRVTDIFDHVDGRRNLQIILRVSSGPSVSDPSQTIAGWVAYRFYFAAATIKMEYKPSVPTSLTQSV